MKHRSIAVVLALGTTTSACARSRTPADAAGLPAGDHRITLAHDGRDRVYFLHVPPTPVSAQPLPVMVAYHGGGGSAEGFQDYAGLDNVADRETFLVVYPDGIGAAGLHTWNAGRCCGRAMQDRADDVGFTAAILSDLAGRLPIDRRRVYATGHSNGAMMAYRLAAERADIVAAIATVAGAMILDAPFRPSRAVPVLHIHSADDPRALYDGGLGPPFPLTNQRVHHEPVAAALAAWIERNGCPTTPFVETTRRVGAAQVGAGHTATLLVHAPCTSGAPVQHWKLTGAGHGWPGDTDRRRPLLDALVGPPTAVVDAAEEAWRFVSQFSLPSGGT